MDGNIFQYYQNQNIHLSVKIRPLMDGNIITLAGLVASGMVKIRPLMDGNVHVLNSDVGIDGLLKSDH